MQKAKNEQPKLEQWEPRPRRPPQLRTPRRLDKETTESRQYTSNCRWQPVNAASTTAAKYGVSGVVPHRLERCCKNIGCCRKWLCCFEQHTSFGQRRSRALGYRRPYSSRVWSVSRVGTLPFFSGLDAASTEAGRCVSAGAPARPLARSSVWFQLWFVMRILRLHSILVFPVNQNLCWLVFICLEVWFSPFVGAREPPVLFLTHTASKLFARPYHVSALYHIKSALLLHWKAVVVGLCSMKMICCWPAVLLIVALLVLLAAPATDPHN